MPGTDIIPKNVYDLSVDDPSLFQQIRKKAWDEVNRRLEDRADEIEDVQLFRLFSEMNKVQMQMEKHADPKSESEKVTDLLEMLTGLPAERQIDLLRQSIRTMDRQGQDVAPYKKALAQLTRGAEDGIEEPERT